MNNLESFIIILIALSVPITVGLMIYDSIRDLKAAKEIESRIKKDPCDKSES